MNELILENLKIDIGEIKGNSFAILIYGSYAIKKAHQRSDIDVCVVLKTNNKEKINQMFKQILKISAKNEKYDIKIFEQMQLFMKIEVIENGKIIYVKDTTELDEYFYFYRKLWQNQSVNWIERKV